MHHSEPDPPRLFLRFFRWFCHPSLKKYIEGDLLELYHERLSESRRRADLNFMIDVLLLFRPGIIKPSFSFHPLNNFAMFKSYLIIGLRNLLKNKSYSIINIGGLTLGLVVVCLIGLWVNDELTFNQYHDNYPRIVQIMKGGTFEGKSYTGQRHLPYPLIGELNESYAGNFKHIVPSSNRWEYSITAGQKIVSALGSYVGSAAPEMFTFQMLYGNRQGLKERDGVMISASVARSLFGDADPLNKQVIIGDGENAIITGVFEDFPINSTLHGLKFFGSWEKYLATNPWIMQQNWDNHFLLIYAELNPALTEAKVSENIRNAEMKAIENLDYMKGSLKYSPMVMLHPMRDWHLRSNFNEGVLETGPAQFVWYMAFIGIFVLILACINFMNLSTARSEKRAREVGVRKTMGSVRFQLISQFYSESLLVVLFSYVIALALITLVLPLFNDLTGKSIRVPLENFNFWFVSISILIVTSFLSGSYPALYLSSFHPVKVLKGAPRAGKNAFTPRRVLVVLQFSISVLLIICTVVVHNQLYFAKDRPVGYQR